MCGVELKSKMVDIEKYRKLDRKDRRRLEKKLKVKIPASNVKNPAIINEMRDEIAGIAAFRAWVQYISLPLMVMHDKHNFGKKRLESMFKDLIEMYNHVEAGRVTSKELSEMLKEETGIDINKLINKYSDLIMNRSK